MSGRIPRVSDRVPGMIELVRDRSVRIVPDHRPLRRGRGSFGCPGLIAGLASGWFLFSDPRRGERGRGRDKARLLGTCGCLVYLSKAEGTDHRRCQENEELLPMFPTNDISRWLVHRSLETITPVVASLVEPGAAERLRVPELVARGSRARRQVGISPPSSQRLSLTARSSALSRLDGGPFRSRARRLRGDEPM